jgi:hypothetical protein
VHGPTGNFWTNLTPSSLKRVVTLSDSHSLVRLLGGGQSAAGEQAHQNADVVLRDRAGRLSEKDAKLAQKLVQFQPFVAVLTQECMGQLSSLGPT